MRDRIRLVGFVAIATIFLASPVWAQDSDGLGLQKHIDIDVKDKPLAMVVEYIRQVTGENIVLGTDKDGNNIGINRDLLVTIKLEGAFWETALNLVCENAGAKVQKLDNNIWKVYQPPEVNLALENADVRVVVDTIARISGKNIVIGSDVGEGKRVTLRVSNLDWERALKVVVESVGLTVVKDADGLVYRIADPANLKKDLVTEVIRLKYLTLPSDYVAKINNELVSGKTEVKSEQERLKNFTLVNSLKEVITAEIGRIDYDITSNSLMITDTPTKIAEIRKIIQLIDTEPQMVKVDVKFISTRRTDVMSVGVEWPNGPRIRTDGSTGLGAMYTRFPFNLGSGGWEDQVGVSVSDDGSYFRRGPTTNDVTTALQGNSPYEFGKINFYEFQMILDFIKNDTHSEIIQKPSLSVLDNQTATIFVGESVRYAEVSVAQTAAGGQSVTISEGQNSPVEIGFQLLVKPHVIPETSKIKVLLIPTLRDLAGNSTTQPGFDTFAIGNQSIDLPRVSASTVVTEMLVEDSETAVIGGLVREIKSEQIVRWPILGDIPLLGYLFKNVRTNKEKRNILLFVTLRLMRDTKSAGRALADRLRVREDEIAQEYYEDIRRERYEAPVEPQPDSGEGAEESPTSEGSSSSSFMDLLERETRSKDEGEKSTERPDRRRSGVRRW